MIVTISGFYCIKAPLFHLELTKQCLVSFLSTYSKVKYALALAVADQTREDEEDDTPQCVKWRLRRDFRQVCPLIELTSRQMLLSPLPPCNNFPTFIHLSFLGWVSSHWRWSLVMTSYFLTQFLQIQHDFQLPSHPLPIQIIMTKCGHEKYMS